VSERCGIGDVVDRDDVDVVVRQGSAHDVAPNSTKPVDAYLYGHEACASKQIIL
jgi:hypothetical protein